jgi:endonuclease VIII
MPEGPEIRRAADRLQAVLLEQTVEEAWFAFERLARFAEALTGARVEQLATHGKAMLFSFDNGLHLYTHNLLWGRWHIVPRGSLPRTNRQLRVALHTATHSALLYSASEIEVLNDDEVAQHPFLQRIGPDVLDPKVDARLLATRLATPRFARRTLAAVLLDQGFASGVGNYIRCEALFVARLHPLRKASACTPAALQELCQALLDVSRRGYEQAGCTVAPEHRARLTALTPAAQRRRRSPRHYIFRRAGEPCLSCGSAVWGGTLSGRPLFICLSCQPAPEV